MYAFLPIFWILLVGWFCRSGLKQFVIQGILSLNTFPLADILGNLLFMQFKTRQSHRLTAVPVEVPPVLKSIFSLKPWFTISFQLFQVKTKIIWKALKSKFKFMIFYDQIDTNISTFYHPTLLKFIILSSVYSIAVWSRNPTML